jgi:hypothetical protein
VWLELPIFDWRFSIADGHWKELPHYFFNRQSAMKIWSLVAVVPRCSTISEILRALRRISAIMVWPRMAGIADFRLLMDIGRSCLTTFSIVNRQ